MPFTMPASLHTFESLTDKEKAMLKKGGEFENLFVDAFECAFEESFQVSFLDDAVVKNLMAEYLKMGDFAFVCRYEDIDENFTDNVCEESQEDLKWKMKSGAFEEVESEKVQYRWESLTPLQKKMTEDGEEFGDLFGGAFYDIFRSTWNICGATLRDLMAEYMTVGHEAFLTHYKKKIKNFMSYVDREAVAKLKAKFPKEMLDGRTYLEKKKENLEEQLAEVNKALTA
jgi:hypothetical protein